MKKKELEQIFIDVANRNETADEMIQELRLRESSGEISESDYDYLLEKWDALLGKHDLL